MDLKQNINIKELLNLKEMPQQNVNQMTPPSLDGYQPDTTTQLIQREI